MKLLPILVLFHFDFAFSDCLLCEDGVAGLKRPSFPVDNAGTVCAKKMHDVYLLDNGSEDCLWEIDEYREICCGEEEPNPVPQTVTRPPSMSIAYVGPHPVCDICWNNKFPGTPAMVINMLDVGLGSCRQFFKAGREGKIVPHLCDTLQVSQFCTNQTIAIQYLQGLKSQPCICYYLVFCV